MKAVWIGAAFFMAATLTQATRAQSAKQTFVRPVSHAHAVELHGVGCGGCVPQGHQWASPHQGKYPWYVPPKSVPCVGIPHGPCCGSIFSEMFCDIKSLWHRMIHCGDCYTDGYCGDLRPARLRDYHMHHLCSADCGCSGGFFSALLTPLVRPFLGCGCHDCYGASTEFGEVWSEDDATTEERTPTPASKTPTHAESLIKPEPANDQHALRHRTELRAAPLHPDLNPPRQAASSTEVRRLSYERQTSSQKASTQRVRTQAHRTQTRHHRTTTDRSPIRFGDNFGKQKRANFGNAKFQ